MVITIAVSEEIADIILAAFVAGVKSEAKKQATAAGKRAVVEGIEESNKQVAKVSSSQRKAYKKLSEAFKVANAKYRLKDGSLRKGRTQADIARLAQKLRKKM